MAARGSLPPPSPAPAPLRKRRRRAVAARGQPQPWGGRLPPELLARIFQAGVEAEGAAPFLCRAARVCREWNHVAAAPQLWRKVTLRGRCYGAAPHKRLPHTALGSVSWLVESRFSLLQEFVLCGWKSHVGFVLKALAARCPPLRSLELLHCEVDPPTLGRFLGAAGARLQRLRLSCGARVGPVLGALAAGACPHLRFLELDAALGGSGPPLALPVERLQAACAELEVLRLRGLSWSPPSGCPAPPRGFRFLRELSLRGSGSGVTDWLLRRLLHAASRLRSLDLSGCARVTPAALLHLPAELELLSLALPGGSEQPRGPPQGSAALTGRWGRSLRGLDLSGRGFEEPDLAGAVAALGPAAPLQALNVGSTKVSAGALSPLLFSCPDLSFLELSSCRRLPRGTKRAHRGRSQVRRCLRVMAGLEPEEEAANEEPPTWSLTNEELRTMGLDQ